MTRLVTAKCTACGRLSGWQVEYDAQGVAGFPCDHCGAEIRDVPLARSEAPIRPQHTPVQRAEWAAERSRDARRILGLMLQAVEEYVRLQDITIEDLPPGSPLRAAALEARLELRKTAP